MYSMQLLVFGAALLTVAYSECPPGWSQHDGNCYKFQKEILNWVDAMTVCNWYYKSHLIIIETEAEQTWFRNKALTYNHTEGDDGLWLGATDWEEEGIWKWATTKQPINPKFWAISQPNNRNNSENCLAAIKNFDYKWSDEFCSWARMQYVCEMKEITAQVVGSKVA